jgi:hypothetical protein
MGYLEFETQPKGKTTSGDIGRGQLELPHLGPALFLELQLVKLHTHLGADSRVLSSAATPEMVRGYQPREREEHGVATWTGSGTAGSIALAFGIPFEQVPDVFITPQDGNANILIGTGVPTKTGVTIYWRDADADTHTSLALSWLAKGP